MTKRPVSNVFSPTLIILSGTFLLFTTAGCGGGGGNTQPSPKPSVAPVPIPGTSPQPVVSPSPGISPAPGASPSPEVISGNGGSPSPTPMPSPGISPRPGESPSPTPSPTPTPQAIPRFTIRWAQRGRTINAPSSALSSVLTLVGARPDGTDAVATVNRNSNRDAYEATYNFPQAVVLGRYTLHVRFFAGQNGNGAVVAEADARPTIMEDGSGIGDITVDSIINSVEVPSQSISYPGKKQLIFSANDVQGNLVAVSPGSAFFSVSAGADYLRISDDQYAEGIRIGSALVVASVDSQRSQPVAIQVTSPALVRISPNDPLISVGGQVRFSAVVDNASIQSVRWRMKNEGTGAIDSNGIYTAPNTPGDYIVIATSDYDPGITAEMKLRVRSGSLPIIIE